MPEIRNATTVGDMRRAIKGLGDTALLFIQIDDGVSPRDAGSWNTEEGEDGLLVYANVGRLRRLP